MLGGGHPHFPKQPEGRLSIPIAFNTTYTLMTPKSTPKFQTYFQLKQASSELSYGNVLN